MTLLATVDWYAVFFLLFASLACILAVAVLFTSNVVRMAFLLTLSLGATAGLFFLAGAHFVGAMQLMIYVGGTLVLLIFGVMLTARTSFLSIRTHGGEWIAALVAGGVLLSLLIGTAFGVSSWRTPSDDLAVDNVETESVAALGAELVETESAAALGAALSGVRVDRLNGPPRDGGVGMSGYHLPFVVVSVHLLVVLIGAAYMARSKRFSREERS
jgi:NADH:ubiquinone oxidoreductase subunit 6 (subunit J)